MRRGRSWKEVEGDDERGGTMKNDEKGRVLGRGMTRRPEG